MTDFQVRVSDVLTCQNIDEADLVDFVDADFGSVDSKAAAAAAAAVDVAAVAVDKAVSEPADVVSPVDRFVAVVF